MTDYDRIRYLNNEIVQEQAKNHAHMATINAMSIRIKQLQAENTALQKAKQRDKFTFTYHAGIYPPRFDPPKIKNPFK